MLYWPMCVLGQDISVVNFILCTTSHFWLWSFLESIERDFIKTLEIQINNQMLTQLSQ